MIIRKPQKKNYWLEKLKVYHSSRGNVFLACSWINNLVDHRWMFSRCFCCQMNSRGVHTRPVWQARVSGVFNVMKAHWVSKGYIQPSHVRLQTGRVDERLNLEISVTLRILPITSQERSSDWNKRRGGDFEYLPPVSPRPACLPPPSATHNCNRGICSCTGGDASTERPLNILIKSKSSPCFSSGTCFWPNVMNSSSLDAIHTWNNPADLCFIPLWKV